MAKTIADVITTINATQTSPPTKSIRDVADGLRQVSDDLAAVRAGVYGGFLFGTNQHCAGPPQPPPVVYGEDCFAGAPDFRTASGREFGAAVDLIAARASEHEQARFLGQLQQHLTGLLASTGAHPTGPPDSD